MQFMQSHFQACAAAICNVAQHGKFSARHLYFTRTHSYYIIENSLKFKDIFALIRNIKVRNIRKLEKPLFIGKTFVN